MDGILIDDDPLMTMGWSMAAKRRGRDIRTFSEPEAFRQIAEGVSREVPLFIDSNLANGVKGELIAKEFFELGFKSIYLVTGYSPSQFGYLPWIKGILDKTPPGWLLGEEGEI